MNIIVCGSSGMLGYTVQKYLNQYYCVSTINRSDVDCNNVSIQQLSDYIASLSHPDTLNNTVLINCIGVIKQRKVADHEMIEINSVLPHKLSLVCNSLNIRMIHFTTDCVYSGNKGLYTENDYHDATDIYGLSKSLGEPQTCSVIRTSIIGEETNNKLSLVEWVKSNANGKINGFTNHFWNGVTCLQAAKIIRKMIEDNLFWSGTRHLYSDVVTKYELVSLISNIYDLKIIIHPKKDTVSINRTLSSNLDISHFAIPFLKNQIKEMKDFYANA